jgi:hypothetical protein
MKKTNTMLSVILLAVIMVFALACSNPAGAGTALAVEGTDVYGFELSVGRLYFDRIDHLPSTTVNPFEVIVTNTGTQETGPLMVELSGDNPECFEISLTSIESIVGDDAKTFTVVPVSFGTIPEREKKAIVTVSSENGFSKSFPVFFDVESTLHMFFSDFSGVFTDDTPQKVYVINSSPWATELDISLVGDDFGLSPDNHSFSQWYQQISGHVPPNGTCEFWVKFTSSGKCEAHLMVKDPILRLEAPPILLTTAP